MSPHTETLSGVDDIDDRLLPTDEVIDLTDRRRVLLRVVFGTDVAPCDAEAVFTPGRAPDVIPDEIDVAAHSQLGDPALR